MNIRETGCAEEFGDIRQAFDMWLNRAGLNDSAEWIIKDVQDALERLSIMIPPNSNHAEIEGV